MISVIVPLYQEEAALPSLLTRLDQLEGEIQVLFSDGGSTDGTRSLLSGRQVITGAKGRAAQCNRAAGVADGSILFFLHCDSVPAPNAPALIQAAVEDGAQWGCLKLQFDDPSLVYRIGARVSNRRVRRGHIAFGDQGIFMTRALFQQIGGFPDLPIMEDYQLSLGLKREKIPPVQLSCPITTSARRFQEGGPFRVAWQMYRLRAMYRQGVDIEEIRRAYRDIRRPL